MRVALSCSLVLAVAAAACGGSRPKPPAAGDGVDTSSLESGGSAPSVAPASSGGGGATSDSSPTAAPASSATAAAPAAPSHPTPSTTGSIDGQPFAPKLAQVAGPLQKDGRLLVVLHEGSDCQTSADAKAGGASMMLMIPWKNGDKVDLGSLKLASKKGWGDATFIRIGADNKNQISQTFKPTGRLTVVSAPMEQNAIGKLKIDLQSGDYMLNGDLDVKVCFPPK